MGVDAKRPSSPVDAANPMETDNRYLYILPVLFYEFLAIAVRGRDVRDSAPPHQSVRWTTAAAHHHHHYHDHRISTQVTKSVLPRLFVDSFGKYV